MREGKLLNGSYFLPSSSLLDFYNNKIFGINKNILLFFESRAELFQNYRFSHYNISQWISFFNFFYKIVPFKKTLKKKYLVNIFFLDSISSYRGWRHARGLPARGQRTWTNAWSVYKSNLVLRHYKIILLRRLYSKVSLSELNLAYAAEQFNLLWKVQWENEWLEAKKRRVQFTKKRQGHLKIDLVSMSSGQLNISKTTQSSGKKKSKVSKNVFNLGFDPGFTKALLKEPSKLYLKKKKK